MPGSIRSTSSACSVSAPTSRDYARETTTITLHYATAIMRSAYKTERIPSDVTIGVRPPVRRGEDADERVGPDDVPTHEEVFALIAAARPYRAAALRSGPADYASQEVLGTTTGSSSTWSGASSWSIGRFNGSTVGSSTSARSVRRSAKDKLSSV